MKVREVIKIKEWVDGSGYNYEETYSDKLVDVAAEEDVQGDFGWDWWEKVEPATGYMLCHEQEHQWALDL